MASSSFVVRDACADDLPEWGSIAGQAFAFKAGDPGRFLANHLADREVVAADVKLACKGSAIAAAVRVLRRKIYMNGEVVEFLGIGDVCTHPSFQRQGAAGSVLSSIMASFDALTAASGVGSAAASGGGSAAASEPSVPSSSAADAVSSTSSLGTPTPPPALPTDAIAQPGRRSERRVIGMLHAMASMRPLYEKFGFKSMPALRSTLRVPVYTTRPLLHSVLSPAYTFRRGDLSEGVSSDIPALAALYDDFCLRHSFSGVTVRSRDRWASWVRHSIGRSLWLVEQGVEGGQRRVLAYCSARYKRGETSCAEFCASEECVSGGAAGVLLVELLGRSVADVWGGLHSPSRPPSPQAPCEAKGEDDKAAMDDLASVAEVVCALPMLRAVLLPTLAAAESSTGVFAAARPLPASLRLVDLAAATAPDPAVVDDGWMYRDVVVPAGGLPIADVVHSQAERHLVWLTDFF